MGMIFIFYIFTYFRVAPDIRLAGYPARKTLHGISFLQNLGIY